MKLVVLGLGFGIVAGWLAVGGAPAAPIRVQAEARPAKVGVGDPIRYTVVARMPASAVDASSVRIFADGGALVATAPAMTTRRVEGATLVVTLVQQLACLDVPCAPADGAYRVRLPVPRVAAELKDRTAAAGRGAPVAIVVEPRVADADVAAASPPYRQQTTLPAPEARAGRLVSPLAVVAGFFALVALLLAVLALWPRSRRDAREAELARAVRLLRESADRPVPDRRRAADLVSRVTGSVGARSVADDAAELAWSERPPEPEGAVALAERAREAGR